ncbi:P-loop containing nucleoside triphosphate hydrolase [Arabidopsis suecica]|uniref:P-loop containing nucleoside triphosphate hydrolase n=1 Tax=Arabidopsis suecica TaxID=45249 RepID=A0A8T2DM95_ARASU|nr:P-loop containing nucleoside triphosphate hydrolase [Arabidopsis suecica]
MKGIEEEASLVGLTIRTSSPASSSSKKGKEDLLQANNNASDSSPSIKNSPFYSPSLVSPPSSAFVSALQSPYISPRATTPSITTHKPSPPLSYKGSQSDDVPSSSYTPPSDQYEFSDEQPSDRKLKLSASCTPDPAPPRISFSFPVPRVSLAKVSVSSPATNTKLRSSDVFIGFHGQNPNLVRFCKWLKSELELQGIACFVADRAKYSDTQSHEIADRVICSVTYGIVVVSCSSLLNYLSLEEVRFFAQKKNLIPIFYGTGPSEIMGLLNCNAIDKECKEAIDGLIKSHEFKLEANESNWRSCVGKTATILRAKLGRKSVADKEIVEGIDELPFPRNRSFLGREKEIIEMEMALFGNGEYLESTTPSTRGEASGQSEGLADEESDVVPTRNGKFISLELGRCSDSRSEAWTDPNGGKNSLKRLLKTKKCRNNSNCKSSTSVVCVNGVPGIGKTELALEFAYRYSQRYKMVLWVGGEARYFRQNLLNLSFSLGLDVSADAEKDRGRLRSFDEQEFEAFKRIKRELFRDMPYLLIIDNLEIEKDWWEGKDLNDLIPRNTGGTHVLITTRLPKVMTFDTVQLSILPSSDAMVLLRGRRKKDYPVEEVEVLKLFDEKLGRLSYGLWVVGSLLSELAILPSALFEAVNKVQIEERSASPFLNLNDEQYCKSNPFVAKVLAFSLAVLEQAEGNRNLLSLKMLLVGAWFAPVPIPVNLLAAAAKNMPTGGNRFSKWNKCLSHTFAWCGGCGLGRRSEEDAAFLLVRLGLARLTNRQPGRWIQFHPITQTFARRRDYILAPKATVQGVRKIDNPLLNLDHLWASAFLVFGFKSEPPLVQLQAMDMVLYIKRTALPLAITAFTTFSRCNSALELLKVCTNVLEEVEKSFVSQIQDWRQGSLCWKKKTNKKVDEYVWQDVTLLKALLLETRAKLLLRGGHFDSGEELCRTCISIRTVMLGHNHDLTLAAQETLAKLVRMRSKI